MAYMVIVCEGVLVVVALVLNGAVIVHKFSINTPTTAVRFTILASCVTQLFTTAFPHALYLECVILPPLDCDDQNPMPCKRSTAEFQIISRLALQTLTSLFIAAAVVTQILEMTSRTRQWTMTVTAGTICAALTYTLGLVLPIFLWMYSLLGEKARRYVCNDVFLPPLLSKELDGTAWVAVYGAVYLLPSVAIVASLIGLSVVGCARRLRPVIAGKRPGRLGRKATDILPRGSKPRTWLPATLIINNASIVKTSKSASSSVCSVISSSSSAPMKPTRQEKDMEERALEQQEMETNRISSGSTELPEQEDVPLLKPSLTDLDANNSTRPVSVPLGKHCRSATQLRSGLSTPEKNAGKETDLLLYSSSSSTSASTKNPRRERAILLLALFAVCLIQLASASLPFSVRRYPYLPAGSDDTWTTTCTLFMLTCPVLIPSFWLALGDV